MNTVDSVCRTCMEKPKHDAIPIDKLVKISYEIVLISNVIQSCTNVKVEVNDGLPQLICETCLKQLKISYLFRQKCIKSDECLRKLNAKDHIYFLEIEPSTDSSLDKLDDDNEEYFVVHLENPELDMKSEPLETNNDVTPESIETISLNFVKDQLVSNSIEIIYPYDKNTSEIIEENFETYKSEDEEYLSDLSNSNGIKNECETDITAEDESNKLLKSKNSLKQHIQTTYKRQIKCEFCEKICTSNARLKEHLLTHTGEKPFKCEVCGVYLKLKSTMKSHMRIHTGETPYKCEYCNKSFRSLPLRATHTKIHTGEAHKCVICDQEFVHKREYAAHKLTHQNKPHACHLCERRFRRKCDLVTHIRVHTGERPYVCHVCGKGFSQSNCLKTHQWLHQKESIKNQKQ